MKMTTLAAAALATLASTLPATADWRAEVPVLRVGIIGGENEADRLRRLSCLKDKLEARLSIPVELYPATDYAGVMQGLLAGQLEMAGLGPVGYAGIYLQDPEAVEPMVVSSNVDGSLGYYSVIITRADSGITDLAGLQGIDIDRYFGRVGFSGGHEQGVIAVLDKQYDAAATWISGIGDRSEGYTRGNLRRMVDKGMLDMNDINIVWQSGIIPNGPTVVRKALPQELKDILTAIYVRMHIEDPECYGNVMGGEGAGYVPVGEDFFAETVELRRREVAASR